MAEAGNVRSETVTAASRGFTVAAGHIGRGAGTVAKELSARRGLRVGALGAALIVVAALLGADSALTIPLIIVGSSMAVIGSLGPRLSGRIEMDWGASGMSLDLKAEIAPPGTTAVADSGGLVGVVPELQGGRNAEAEVIESTGETIEIEVAELEALMEAAEATKEVAPRGRLGESAPVSHPDAARIQRPPE